MTRRPADAKRACHGRDLRSDGIVVDMSQSLLTDLVLRRGLQPEPIATSGLTHILRSSEAARAAVGALVQELAPGVPTATTWRNEVGSLQDSARPDLIGSCTDRTCVVIEAKFDAELTPGQTDGTYLGRLEAGVPGALIFLVPADRVELLVPTLVSAYDLEIEHRRVSEASDHTRWLSYTRPDNRTIGVVTWPLLLDRIDTALTVASERSDLDQLRALVSWYISTSWVPRAVGDLSNRTARQIKGLLEAVILVGTHLGAQKWRISQGNSDYANGRWLKSPAGSQVWIGLWLDQWLRHEHSPLWLQAAPKENGLSSDAIRGAWKTYEAEGRLIAHPTDGWTIPVDVGFGAEKAEVVATITDLVLPAVALLDAARSQLA